MPVEAVEQLIELVGEQVGEDVQLLYERLLSQAVQSVEVEDLLPVLDEDLGAKLLFLEGLVRFVVKRLELDRCLAITALETEERL